VVWPPPHRRDRQRRSLSRTNPADRGKPAWGPESVRLATTVGDLQGDVFIEGSALDRLPTVTFSRRRPHRAFSNLERRRQYLSRWASIQDGRTINSVDVGAEDDADLPLRLGSADGHGGVAEFTDRELTNIIATHCGTGLPSIALGECSCPSSQADKSSAPPVREVFPHAAALA
jgi:hypothetical protein